MRRHLVTLERDRENLEQSIRLCAKLTDCRERLCDLNAGAVLAEMETLEQTGTTFQNKQRRDVRIRYVAPVAITLGIVALMGGIVGLLLWAMVSESVAPPSLLLLAVLAAVPLAVMGGAIWTLIQRIQEIGKGEEDDAKTY